jgi:putative Ca2+/H+ antiporter (TMEM165/GDT1 family)
MHTSLFTIMKALFFIVVVVSVSSFRPHFAKPLSKHGCGGNFLSHSSSGDVQSLPSFVLQGEKVPLDPILSRQNNNYDVIAEAESLGNGNRFTLNRNFVLRKLRMLTPVLLAGALAFLRSNSAFASSFAGSDLVNTLTSTSDDGGFLQSFLLIFISEIGDKTFFIAGLLAAKYGRFVSFTGSIGALAVMTVISTVLGQLFHAIPPSLTQGVPYDDVIAVLAFTYFGLKTLFDASQLKNDDNSGIEEEKAEAVEIVEEFTAEQKRDSAIAQILQTFSLVFAAEIGDRSFLSTIALSAALNPYAVASGAIAAHASATGVAVAGGVLLSKYLSEKVIGYIGGGLFLVFAVTTALHVF